MTVTEQPETTLFTCDVHMENRLQNDGTPGNDFPIWVDKYPGERPVLWVDQVDTSGATAREIIKALEEAVQVFERATFRIVATETDALAARWAVVTNTPNGVNLLLSPNVGELVVNDVPEIAERLGVSVPVLVRAIEDEIKCADEEAHQ